MLPLLPRIQTKNAQIHIELDIYLKTTSPEFVTSIVHSVLDTFELSYLSQSGYEQVPVLTKGIAWTTDKTVKFENPEGFDVNASLGEFSSSSCVIVLK